MPARYTIDAEQRLVRIRAWGTVTDDGARTLYERLRSDPSFDPTYCQLADFREVTDVALTHDVIAGLAANPLYATGVRRAVVVGSDVHYGLARIFSAYATFRGQNVTVFRDLRSAEAWLDRAGGSAAP